MGTRDTDTRISLVIDKDYLDNTVKPAKESRHTRSLNQFIRDAIDQYVNATPRDARLAQIVEVFGQLNDSGKDWLLDCARAAVGKAKFKDSSKPIQETTKSNTDQA